MEGGLKGEGEVGCEEVWVMDGGSSTANLVYQAVGTCLAEGSGAKYAPQLKYFP